MIRTDAAGIPLKVEVNPRQRKPDPSGELNREIESTGSLIGDCGIVSRLRCPLLDHDAGRVLHRECRSDVEQIQRSVGAPGQLLRKILGQNSIAEHGSRTDRRHNGP